MAPGAANAVTDATKQEPIDLRRRPRMTETFIQGFLFLCAVLSIFTTVGIVYELSKESLDFFTRQLWEDTNKPLAANIDAGATTFKVSTSGSTLHEGDIVRVNNEVMELAALDGQTVTVARGLQGTEVVPHEAGIDIFRSNTVSLREFFGGTKWNPQIGQFGIWPLVNSTLMVSTIAMLVALPLGLGVAIYLSEYASNRARSTLKPILEVLAGIPTVVYGYFALTFMTPLLRSILGRDVVEIYNTASAGIVIGVLIIPLVSSMSEDALSAVPRSLREASYGLGATKLETAVRVVVPAALSGITAAFIIAISRAIGETMIVAIAAGAGPNFTLNPFESAETMTGHIVRISGGDISYDSIDYNSIFAIGLMLFFMTLALNVIGQRVVHRYREAYE
ncbi:MAG: Phosphate transport system permease protein PstC 1 [Anaerolineales bacterium]|nr:Phosphate transport system permease protein PstC 1 [Anaerolineales bacterium]